jgi:hypothetical protein
MKGSFWIMIFDHFFILYSLIFNFVFDTCSCCVLNKRWQAFCVQLDDMIFVNYSVSFRCFSRYSYIVFFSVRFSDYFKI